MIQDLTLIATSDDPNSGTIPTDSSHVGNTHPVQTHVSLDKAPGFVLIPSELCFLTASTERSSTMIGVWVWVFLSILGGVVVFQQYGAEITSPTGMLVIACTLSFIGIALFPEAVRKYWIGISAALVIPTLIFSCAQDVYCGSIGQYTQKCAEYRVEKVQMQRSVR